MASTDVKIPAKHLMRDVTLIVNVTGVKTWRARLWVGTHLIKLAARVMGCGIEFEKKER